MKTKDLIKQLQELDPSGEMDCVVNNEDISCISIEPSYWDGCKQLMVRDKNGFIVGAEYRSDGQKVQIETMNIKWALLDQPDLPVEVVDTFVHKQMQKQVDEWRQEIKDIKTRKNVNENDTFNCNHHHKLTDKQKIVNFGTGDFVADVERISLLKELNKCGLITRTHCYGHNSEYSFVGIIMDNVDIEVRKVSENRDTFKDKMELLIRWKKKD